MNALIPLFLILIFVGMIFLGIRWMLKSLMDGLRKQYQLFSKNLGVNAQITDAKFFGFGRMPRLDGSLLNRTFKLYSIPAGTGRSMQNNDTFFEISSPKLTGLSFSMAKKSLFKSVAESLGEDFVKTGVQEFDDQFILRSNKPNFLKRGLDTEIRKALIEHKNILKGSLKFNDQGFLQYSERINISKDSDRIRFEKIIKLCVRMLDVFEHNAQPIV